MEDKERLKRRIGFELSVFYKRQKQKRIKNQLPENLVKLYNIFKKTIFKPEIEYSVAVFKKKNSDGLPRVMPHVSIYIPISDMHIEPSLQYAYSFKYNLTFKEFIEEFKPTVDEKKAVLFLMNNLRTRVNELLVNSNP